MHAQSYNLSIERRVAEDKRRATECCCCTELLQVVANCWPQPRIHWMDCLGFDASFRRVGEEERVVEVAPWASLMYYTA